MLNVISNLLILVDIDLAYQKIAYICAMIFKNPQ